MPDLWRAEGGVMGDVEWQFVCQQCGRAFEDYPSESRKYCSKRCADEARRTVRPKCKVCGKPVRLMRNIYCSRSCRNKDLGFQRADVTSYSGLYRRVHELYPNPEPCAICGAPGKHRHHPDYRKPFDIVWLCESCHHKLHPRNKKVRTEPVSIHE